MNLLFPFLYLSIICAFIYLLLIYLFIYFFFFFFFFFRLHNHVEYVQRTGKLVAGQKFIVYSVVAAKVASKLAVLTKSTANLDLLTIVKYSKAVASSDVARTMKSLNEQAKADYDQLIVKDVKVLKADHVNAWHQVHFSSKYIYIFFSQQIIQNHHWKNESILSHDIERKKIFF